MDPTEVLAAWIGANYTKADGQRFDAGETAMLARSLEYVKSKTYDVKYSALKARSFIPVNTSTPAGADSITYRQWDQFGMAKIIANYADDLPRVDVLAKEFTTPVKSLGASYGYSIQDLRRSALSGMQLDTARASAARRAIESAMDEILAFGLPEAGLPGFLTNPNVPVVSLPTGAWAGGVTTHAQVLADLHYLVKTVVTNTKTIYIPDTMLLDVASFQFLAGTTIGADLNATLLQAFLRTNPHIKNIDMWEKLDTADAARTGPRIVVYLRDPEVVEGEIPQEFEQFPPQPRMLAFDVPCHGRVGGTVIRHPLSMAYADNHA